MEVPRLTSSVGAYNNLAPTQLLQWPGTSEITLVLIQKRSCYVRHTSISRPALTRSTSPVKTQVVRLLRLRPRSPSPIFPPRLVEIFRHSLIKARILPTSPHSRMPSTQRSLTNLTLSHNTAISLGGSEFIVADNTVPDNMLYLNNINAYEHYGSLAMVALWETRRSPDLLPIVISITTSFQMMLEATQPMVIRGQLRG